MIDRSKMENFFRSRAKERQNQDLKSIHILTDINPSSVTAKDARRQILLIAYKGNFISVRLLNDTTE